MLTKQIHDPTKSWIFKDEEGNIAAAYFPEITLDTTEIWDELCKMPFTRVYYVSQYGKANRTPRLTWAYGQVNSNTPVDQLPTDLKASIIEKYGLRQDTRLRCLPDPRVKDAPTQVTYRQYGLDFMSEVMPEWLERLSLYVREIALLQFGIHTDYNSCIIGKYENGDDQIAFHTDTEPFLAHHFCANVTLGWARDFQFKDAAKQTHEIKLGHKSLFFFLGLEHALPKRAGVKPGEIRFSISFRNMAKNDGIGNSFYYCRGLAGAVDNDRKRAYAEKLQKLMAERGSDSQ